MRLYKFIFLLLLTIVFSACAGKNTRIIIVPEPGQEILPEQIGPPESWEIIESQNGPGETDIPEWVYRYYNREIRYLESGGPYGGKYLFVGRSQGNSLNALQQWVNGFTVEHNLPRLVSRRVERRLVASLSLYPDDEYGEYFENLMKKVSDSEYSGTLEEPIFWVKRKRVSVSEESADDTEPAEPEAEVERYEFLALIGTDKETLQKQLTDIMTGIKTTVPPTRNQTAAINRIRQSFFEGF